MSEICKVNLDIRPGAVARDKFTVAPARHFKYPGGEVHVDVSTVQPNANEVTIITALRTSDDIMSLLLTANALRNRLESKNHKIYAFIPYIPYGRQDRVANAGDPFSLNVMAQLINSCKFSWIYTIDPHSSVTGREVHRLINLSIVPFVSKSPIFDLENVVLCAPDKGAGSRVKVVADELKREDIITAYKERDSLSGRLNFVGFSGSPLDKNVLIVDDVCDGGGTFKGLAPKLLEDGAKSVHLYVTHGIFSQGLDGLYEAGITSITTTNSIYEGMSTNELFVLDVITTAKAKGLVY